MKWLRFVVKSIHFRLIIILFALQTITLFLLLFFNSYLNQPNSFVAEETLYISSDYLRNQALQSCEFSTAPPLSEWQDVVSQNPGLRYYYKRGDCEFSNFTPSFDQIEQIQTITENLDCRILDGFDENAGELHYLFIQKCHSDTFEHMEITGLSIDYQLPFFEKINTLDSAVVDPQMVIKSYIVMLILLPIVILFCLKPLRKTASLVSGISIHSKTKQLPITGLFSEVVDLIRAFNSALQRLDEGRRRETNLRHTIAHELKTPLTCMRNDLELIEDSAIKQTLITDVQRMNALIERILKFARITFSKLKIQS